MRPGNERDENVLVVLDKKSELKVVLDAVEDVTFLREHAPPFDPKTYRGSTLDRFRSEAREMEHYSSSRMETPPGFIEVESWRIEPKFRVQTQDIDFVKSAAERTLREHNAGDLMWNVITGRRRAAKAILATLVKVQ